MLYKFASLLVGSVCAQLSTRQQERLVKLAEEHLSSHYTRETALAGQVLHALNSIKDSQKTNVCNNISNTTSGLTEKETYYQAEVYRYFGCKKLQASVK